MHTPVFAALLGLVISFHTCFALKCYRCDSKKDPKCSDPFDVKEGEKLSMDCGSSLKEEMEEIIDKIYKGKTIPDEKLACTKLVNKKGQVYRACGLKMTAELWCEELKSLKRKKEKEFSKEDDEDHFACLICQSELCNTATSFQASNLAFSFFILIKYIFVLKN